MTVEETWELAKKLTFLDKDNGFNSGYFNTVFKGMNKNQVFELSPYEVQKRINTYEKENEICIGDIVVDKDDIKYIVLDECENNGIFYLLSENGCVERINSSLLRKRVRTNYIKQIIKHLQEYSCPNG